jgi:hypothetical protein
VFFFFLCFFPDVFFLDAIVAETGSTTDGTEIDVRTKIVHSDAMI